MVTTEEARKLALSFPEVVELPHFERTSFRVNKKIFATMAEKEKLVMVKLSLIDQSAFCAFDKTIIYPVPGGWGKQGATYIELKKIRKSVLKDALITAYYGVAPKKITDLIKTKR
ncbi:MAG TPA: MmcQ/YjbR family DNA-binding protein [Bacteroidia bacterium]|nr:MmcQ/YjbR family DNA-binding protein [Bacteroidia bacterium]